MNRFTEQAIDNHSYQLRLKINDTDMNKELNMSNLEEEQEIDNQSYEVEKILDFRYKKGKPEYKLKWKSKLGYVINLLWYFWFYCFVYKYIYLLILFFFM